MKKSYLKLFFICLIAATSFLVFSIMYFKASFLIRNINVIKATIYRALIMPQAQPTVKLKIKPYFQKYSLSCEVATFKMALAAYGIDISEDEILNYLPFDLTTRTETVWGNPHSGFVGKINGQMLKTGYGVYWEPLARLGLRWKRTEIIQNANFDQITSHLNAGHPVIVWGFLSNGHKTSWLTKEGILINAVAGEHARLVVGYTGNSSMPTGFYLLDPIYGELYWDITTFDNQWMVFDRVVLVVYPHPAWVKTEQNQDIWEISKNGSTRHLLKLTWTEFLALGGYSDAIKTISLSELERYPVGDPLYSL